MSKIGFIQNERFWHYCRSGENVVFYKSSVVDTTINGQYHNVAAYGNAVTRASVAPYFCVLTVSDVIMTEGEKPRPCASGDKCPPRARPPDTDKEREISYWRWRLVCSWLRHSFTGWIEERWTIAFRKLYCQTWNSFVPVEYSYVHLKNILNLPKIFHSLIE